MLPAPLIHRRKDRRQPHGRMLGGADVMAPHHDIRTERRVSQAGMEMSARAERQFHRARDQRARHADVQQLDPMPQLDADALVERHLDAVAAAALGGRLHSYTAFIGGAPPPTIQRSIWDMSSVGIDTNSSPIKK
jgi:hypothetical protein